MEHDEAVRSQAAERYVAHELSPAERDAFEEHFFDCQECADDVRFEMTFAANARAVFREQRTERRPAPEPRAADSRGSWLDWLRPRPALAFSFAANFALAAGLGYVLLTGTHELAVPQFGSSIMRQGLRTARKMCILFSPGESFYQVHFSAPGAAGQSYSYEVLDAAGKRESSGSLKAPASEDAELYLQLPVRSLPAGVHTLVVRGGDGGEIVSWSRFRISR